MDVYLLQLGEILTLEARENHPHMRALCVAWIGVGASKKEQEQKRLEMAMRKIGRTLSLMN